MTAGLSSNFGKTMCEAFFVVIAGLDFSGRGFFSCHRENEGRSDPA
jgi:hypothetical protein